MTTISPATPTGLVYYPDFLTELEHQPVLVQVQALPCTHDRFRGQVMKRSQATFGFAYAAIGRKVRPAAPFPPFLAALSERARHHTSMRPIANQCIVQHYPTGAGIGWHTDAPVFGDVIMGISFGGPARLQFRPRGETPARYEVVLMPGSLYVMAGPSRWEWQHRVVPVSAPRYSLTFRVV